MIQSDILTPRELQVINKKLANKKLTQQDSNYLSKYVRPKLREISKIDAALLLNKIKYNQKSRSIEKKIIKITLENIKDVDSIILYGSAIQTNYHDYNDIDIMIVTKKKLYKAEMEKWRKIKELKDILKNYGIISDIEIISKENLLDSYKNSPTLIYQLKDHKIIYGKIKIPKETAIYRIDLIMKLDWSDLIERPTGKEIYSALRNAVLVRLILNKIIDNSKLKEYLYNELGKNLISKLKNNQASKEEKKYAINYLNELIRDTSKQLEGELWEKIELSR
ncbi:MAG: nucleotidyltransferase domain-containing protein [Nanoarchaeota archaeon]|nr:nucleotidyltransferase domain-containing protein [Nanoarchaeota archaeon]